MRWYATKLWLMQFHHYWQMFTIIIFGAWYYYDIITGKIQIFVQVEWYNRKKLKNRLLFWLCYWFCFWKFTVCTIQFLGVSTREKWLCFCNFLYRVFVADFFSLVKPYRWGLTNFFICKVKVLLHLYLFIQLEYKILSCYFFELGPFSSLIFLIHCGRD